MGSFGRLLQSDSNLPISPALKAEIMDLIHSYSVPTSVWRIGCCSFTAVR